MPRQQKIDFFGQFQPTGVDQTAGARLRSLAGLAEQVGDIAFEKESKRQREEKGLLEKRQKKEGRIAGMKISRDEEGNVIPPEVKDDMTIFGESFNRSAVLAHRAQIQIDTKQSLDELQEIHKLSPEDFRSAAQSFRQGTLKGMPDELANIIGLDIDSSVQSRFSTLNKAFFKREDEKQKAVIAQSIESATDDILNATREGDLERQQRLVIEQTTALDAAIAEGLVDPVKAEQIKEQVQERITEQDALRQIDEVVFNENLTLEEKVSHGLVFVDSLRKSKELKDLSPEQKDSLVNVVGAKVNGLQTQLTQEKSKKTIDQTRQISNLKVNAKMGFSEPSVLVEETETLFNTGLITGNERTSILTDILNGQKEKQDIAKKDSLVAQKLSGNFPEIVVDQKTVSDFYERNIKDQFEGLPSNIKIAEQANIIDKLKIIPTQVKQELSNNILSGDPELIKQASDLVDRIDEIPGIVNLAVNANQRAFINSVVDLSQNMEPEEAVALAKELTDPRDKARIEAKEFEIKDEKMREDYPDVVEDAFEGFFGGDFLVDNVNKESVNSEFEQLFESFFKAGMNKDRAEEKSISILKNNWKDSQFGFMKHPPETFYSVGGEVDYIKNQLVKDISSEFTGFEFEKDNVFLLSDEQTARKASQGQPDYRVMVLDDNGEIQMLDGRWKPDMESQAKKQTKANQELFDKKRKSRQEGDFGDNFLSSVN